MVEDFILYRSGAKHKIQRKHSLLFSRDFQVEHPDVCAKRRDDWATEAREMQTDDAP